MVFGSFLHGQGIQPLICNPFLLPDPVSVSCGVIGLRSRILLDPQNTSQQSLGIIILSRLVNFQLYKYHAMHHKTKGSVGISGMYASVLDGWAMSIGAGSLGLILVDSHVVVVWLWSFIGALNSIHRYRKLCINF